MIHATMNTLFTAMQLTLEIENMPESENRNFYLGNYRRLCLCPSKADRPSAVESDTKFPPPSFHRW